jgi:MFS family permease
MSLAALRLILLLVAVTAASQFYRASAGVIAPELMHDLAICPETLGLASSAFFMALGLAQIPVGMLFDRIGPRRTVGYLTLLAVAGTLLHALADSGLLLILSRAVLGFGAVLLPVWAQETGHGPEAIGLILGASSACAMAFSLLAAAIAHRLPRQPVYLIGFLIGGAPRFLILAIGAPLWAIVGVYAVCGLASGFLNPMLGALMFERAPPEMYGRERSLMAATLSSGVPFGGLAGGTLVAIAGLNPALLICGALYFLTTMLPGLQKEWNEMDRDRRRVPPGSPG